MDSEIAAERTRDSVNINVNVKNSKGKSFHIKFSKGVAGNAPERPVILSTRAISPSSAVIEWHNDGTADSYKIMRSRDRSSGYAAIADVSGMTSSYTDSGLGSGIRYYYKIAAMNENGISDYSEYADIQTVPQAPLELRADGYGERPVLTWKNVPGANAYKIFRSENEKEGFACITPEGCFETAFADKDAEKNVNYYYKVVAVNDGGESDFSDTAASMYGKSGIVVQEDFDNFSTGELGENNWFPDVDSDGKNRAEIVELSDSDKALRITRNVGTVKCGAIYPFDVPEKSIVTIEEKIVPESPTGDYKTVMLVTDSAESGKAMIHVFCQNGSLTVYNGQTRKVVINGGFDYGKEYCLKAVINTVTKKFDFYADGVLLASGFSYRDSSAKAVPKCFGISTGNVMNIMTLNYIKISYSLPSVSGAQVQMLSDGSARLSYGAVDGAKGYSVFKASCADEKYRLIYCGENTYFTDSHLTVGSKNRYIVCAVLGECVSAPAQDVYVTDDSCGIFLNDAGIFRGNEKIKLSCIEDAEGSYTVKSEYVSTSDVNISALYMAAIYADNEIKGLHSENVVFSPGEEHTFSSKIDIPAEWNGKKIFVKCFLWENKNSLMPITACCRLD